MIQITRLITGEEIVADVTDNADGTFKFKTPVRIMMTQEGVGMGHVSPFAKADDLTIKREHIVWSAEVDDEMRNAYSSQFGSGIVLATAQPPVDLKSIEIK